MQRILLNCFILVLVLAPFPIGSNRDWAWSPLAIATGVLLLAWGGSAVAGVSSARRAFASSGNLLVPVALVTLVFGWALVQISGWTPAGWASPISASGAFGASATTQAIGFERDPSVVGLLRLMTYLAVFVLAASLPEHAGEARRILAGIICAAIAVTVFGLVATTINRLTPYTGLAVWVPNPDGLFTGTFTNGNNYATYAGISALAALVLAIPPPRAPEFRESAAQRWRRRLRELSGPRALWFAALLLLVTGVILTGSRAGAASLLIGLLTVALAYARGIRRFGYALAIIVALIALVVTMPGGDKLIFRTGQFIATAENSRREIWEITIGAIELRPWLGWGLGSYADLFFVFQPASFSSLYADKAHNTYLELAFELGIPAAAMLLSAVLWIVLRCAWGFYTRGRDRELAGLGVFATVLVAFHAIFDFGMQIPAVACTYFAILGVAWNQSWSSRRS